METLAVSAAAIDGNRHEIAVGDRTLWYEFSDTPMLSSPVTAAVALLPYAMSATTGLHIDGEVDPVMLGNLEEFVDYWSLLRPDLFRRIPVTAEAVVAAAPGPRRAVAAFSGGVDGTYQLVANTTGANGHRAVPIGAAVLVAGFDIPVDDREGMDRAIEHARPVLDRFGVPLVTVRTNWREFNPDWEMSFAAAVAAVLHCFRDRAGIGLMGADEPYNMEVRPWGSSSSTNHLLGGGDFLIRTDGLDVTRTEKCALIGQHEVVREHLRVCWAGVLAGENCGRCEKCVRTKLNFAAAGVGDIPALGALTNRQATGVKVSNQVQLSYLAEVAEQLPPPLSRAVRTAIARNRLQFAKRRLRAATRKLLRVGRRR